jgi:type IV pilus assembly protein PilN
MRITLNLATRPFADIGPAIKRLRIAMGVLALLAILLFVALHAIHQKAEAARARDHSLDGQIARIAQERRGYEQMMQQPPNAQLLKQSAVLNKLFDAKAFSWTLAMEDLETVLPGGVQVTTLEPERQKDGRIMVHLRVIGPRNGDVDLVRNLEHSRHFVVPHIVSENAEATGGPNQPLQPVSASDRVQFDLLAEYSPASPEAPSSTGNDSKRNTGSETRKPGRKSIKADNPEASPFPANRTPVRPLPLHPDGQNRPPYTGTTGLPTPPGPGPSSANPAPPSQVPGGPQ